MCLFEGLVSKHACRTYYYLDATEYVQLGVVVQLCDALADHVRRVLVARPSDSTCAHGTQGDRGCIYAALEILSTHRTNNSFANAKAMWVCRDW